MNKQSAIPFNYYAFNGDSYVIVRREGRRFFWTVFTADFESGKVYYGRRIAKGVSGSLARALKFANLYR